MRILLTNDDSHQSPLLQFAMTELSHYGEVTTVVPKHEQSWKGKSMSRFGYIHQENIEIAGRKAYTIDGTPADCVHIAAYHLLDKKPDLVVAGINAGLNAGTGFVLSSGTVGACLEANIAGIPAIALSQHFDSDTRQSYLASYIIPEATYKRLEAQTKVILGKVLPTFFANPHLLTSDMTWNINLPIETTAQSRIIACPMGKSVYGSCYKESDASLNATTQLGAGIVRYEHDLSGYSEDTSPNCDSRLLSQGHVTITPINVHTLGQLSSDKATELNQIFGSKL